MARWVALTLLLWAMTAQAEPLRPFVRNGDRVDRPLTDQPGDPVRGRQIIVSRQSGLCLLCHQGPFPEIPLQGNLAPDLSGVGLRYTPGQLRALLIDARSIHPDSLMPAFYKIEGRQNVGAAFQDRPLLEAQQIEDVVACLMVLQ